MFYYFFTQYKKEILDQHKRKLHIKEIIMLTAIIILTVSLSVSAILQNLVLTSLLSVAMFVVMFVVQKKQTQKEYAQLNENLADFKTTKIAKLESLLKHANYKLYTEDGLDLLITCCDKQILKSTVKLPFQGIVTSVFLLAYSTVITNITSTEVIASSIIFIICVMVLALFLRGYQPIVDSIIYPDKAKYIELKNELEYIKTQIK